MRNQIRGNASHVLPPGLRVGMQNLNLRDTRRLCVARTRPSSDARKLLFRGLFSNTDNLHYSNKIKELRMHTHA